MTERASPAAARAAEREFRWADAASAFRVVAEKSGDPAADPMPMLTLFDKQLQLRMGQCNAKKWIGDIMPPLGDDDPLGCDTFATYRLPLDQAPDAYRAFQQKADGHIKIQLKPSCRSARGSGRGWRSAQPRCLRLSGGRW